MAETKMVSIEIDGKIYQVPEGDNLLQACLSQGLDLPYFCWHPAMGSVGACRQCALIQYNDRHDEEGVEERDEQGRIVMGCMTPVSEGMRVSLNAESAKDFRGNVIEFLMTNHPHDCPVCEEGGECHLQDMTVMTGHTARDYRNSKRTHRNQYLGPFINHEMNRCIACYRCERFYQDYAGGSDLQAMGAHNHVFFGRHEDGVLESPFSGNLVEVCPTGVFTDKTLSQRYSRKWDLQTAPSICTHCATGCNTSPGERYGEVRRVVNRYNGAVNGYFLCDRGRFGYGFVNGDERIKQAVQFKSRDEGEPVPDVLDRSQTRDLLADVLQAKTIVGIGSPRATVESNFALRRLVGEQNFYPGFSDSEAQLMQRILQVVNSGAVRIPSLNEVEQADAVLVLGEDVLNSSPRLALSLRQTARNAALDIADELRIPHWQDAAVREAAQSEKTPLYILSPAATDIDDIAASAWNGSVDQIAQLGFAIAHAIHELAPVADGGDQDLISEIADTLKQAKRPLIISGTGSQSAAVIEAAANIAKALVQAKSNGEPHIQDLLYCLPEANSMGLAMLAGERLDQGLSAALKRDDADLVVILENDLYRRESSESVDHFFKAAKQVLVLDHHMTTTAMCADMVLPAASFAEAEGTLVSSEGRAQRFFPVQVPKDDVRPAWEWLSDAVVLHSDTLWPWQHSDEVTQDCANSVDCLRGIAEAAPSAQYRVAGMKIARQPHRYSGRTAMLANRNVSEPKQPQDEDSALGFTMEGFPGEKPASLTPYYWSPGWNSNQSVGKFQQEINGPLKGGDPGVRLIEPGEGNRLDWFEYSASDAAGEGWTVLPLYRIFGSEELSVLSAPIAERAARTSVSLSPADADSLGVESGDGILLGQGEQQVSLEVSLDASVKSGAVGVPMGLPETLDIAAHSRVHIIRDENWVCKEPKIIASSNGAQS